MDAKIRTAIATQGNRTGQAWVEQATATLYLRPTTMHDVRQRMQRTQQGVYREIVEKKKLPTIEGLSDFTTAAVNGITIPGHELHGNVLVGVYLINAPTTIPRAPPGTIRTYTLYCGAVQAMGDDKPEFGRGTTYVCPGSDSPPELRPVPDTTPVVVVTTHKVRPKEEKAEAQQVYTILEVERAQPRAELAVVRVEKSSQRGAVTLRPAKGFQWTLTRNMIETPRLNGSDLYIQLRKGQKPIRGRWEHWTEKWLDWTSQQEKHHLAIRAPNREAANDLLTWIWDRDQAKPKPRPLKIAEVVRAEVDKDQQAPSRVACKREITDPRKPKEVKFDEAPDKIVLISQEEAAKKAKAVGTRQTGKRRETQNSTQQ